MRDVNCEEYIGETLTFVLKILSLFFLLMLLLLVFLNSTTYLLHMQNL